MTDEELIKLCGALRRRSQSAPVVELCDEVLWRLAHGTMRREVGLTKDMAKYMRERRKRKKALADLEEKI